jgi:hypothetical protein
VRPVRRVRDDCPQVLDQFVNLVPVADHRDPGLAIRRHDGVEIFPVAPTLAVGVRHVTVRLRPAVPYMSLDEGRQSAALGTLVRDDPAAELPDVRVAAQKPEDLVDHDVEVELLGRDRREPPPQVEAELGRKQEPALRLALLAHEQRSALDVLTLVDDPLHQVKILPHRPSPLRALIHPTASTPAAVNL